MNERRERKKTVRTWLVRGFAVLGMAFSFWTLGGVVLSATGCKVGVYDCVGELYLYLGNVGIGTQTPGQKLSVAGTIESTTGGYKFPDGTTQTTAPVIPPHGKQRFTASGTFTVPVGVTTVWVSMSGGGGGGNCTYGGAGGGGGGGANAVVAQQISVTPGTNVAVTVGGGGSGALFNICTGSSGGGPGGASSFGANMVAGGSGGTGATGGGAAGGSGGTRGGNLDASIGGPGGTGGGSIFGSGGPGLANAVGGPGGGYGGGGGGSTGSVNGGAGAPGFVLVEW